MRAAYYERTGPAAEVIEIGDVPMPEAAAGEVLVRLRASGINPHDTKLRSGWLNRGQLAPRVILHADGAGVIEAVGDGVSAGRIGERVWVHNPRHRHDAGTAADYMTLPAGWANPLPDQVSFAEGACLGVPAGTAQIAILSDGSVAGQTILVAGGAGAVAHYAIQFAKLDGAEVISTASGPEKAAHAKAAGADHIINYREEDVTARVEALTGGAGVDRIAEVDFGANLSIDTAILRPGGVIASYSSTAVREPVLPYYAFALKGITVHFVQAFLMPEDRCMAVLAHIQAQLMAGRLINTVGARFPLAEIAAAHEAQESGSVMGNVVVEID